MNPSIILAECWSAGISLRVEGDRLLFDAPRGALSPALLLLLRTYKEQVVELLSWLQEAGRTPAQAVDPVYCLRIYEKTHGRGQGAGSKPDARSERTPTSAPEAPQAVQRRLL